jgi:hypothetical protein
VPERLLKMRFLNMTPLKNSGIEINKYGIIFEGFNIVMIASPI